jgi:hypothetical protein
MAPILLALALFLQGQPAPTEASATSAAPPAEAATPAAETPPEDRLPPGAPRDDYPFVAWCYGSLRGYLDLHDQVMPEVTRIESTYRPPGRKLSDDLKVYGDMQKDGRRQLKIFQAALTAAEKASVHPINTIGAAAVAKGRSMWAVTPGVTPARLAQEWMSWALPARCETTAKDLKAKATLMGASFKVNEEPDAAPEPPPAPPAEASANPPPAEALLPNSAPAPAPAEAPQPETPKRP